MGTSLLRTVTAANSVKVSLLQDKIGPYSVLHLKSHVL